MSEEFNVDAPFNPKINKIFAEFIERQRAAQPEYPEGTKFECRQCGECCTWHYFRVNVQPRVRDGLPKWHRRPNGFWILESSASKLHFFMPVPKQLTPDPKRPWFGTMVNAVPIHFEGPLPKEHIEFLTVTGRMHGYWVLNDEGKVAVYCPTECQHLTGVLAPGAQRVQGHCAIYPKRPQICRDYWCRRYPVAP